MCLMISRLDSCINDSKSGWQGVHDKQGGSMLAKAAKDLSIGRMLCMGFEDEKFWKQRREAAYCTGSGRQLLLYLQYGIGDG